MKIPNLETNHLFPIWLQTSIFLGCVKTFQKYVLFLLFYISLKGIVFLDSRLQLTRKIQRNKLVQVQGNLGHSLQYFIFVLEFWWMFCQSLVTCEELSIDLTYVHADIYIQSHVWHKSITSLCLLFKFCLVCNILRAFLNVVNLPY